MRFHLCATLALRGRKEPSNSPRRPTLPTIFSTSTSLLPRKWRLLARRALLKSSKESRWLEAGFLLRWANTLRSRARRLARVKSLSTCSLRSIYGIIFYPYFPPTRYFTPSLPSCYEHSGDQFKLPPEVKHLLARQHLHRLRALDACGARGAPSAGPVGRVGQNGPLLVGELLAALLLGKDLCDLLSLLLVGHLRCLHILFLCLLSETAVSEIQSLLRGCVKSVARSYTLS